MSSHHQINMNKLAYISKIRYIEREKVFFYFELILPLVKKDY